MARNQQSPTRASSADAIRLTGTSYAVLSLLDLLGEATPYDLKQTLERSIENFWPVPHTTFYAEPERLAAAGLLVVEQEAGGRRRKLYRLTEQGRAALREWALSPELAPPQLREEATLKVLAGGDPVALFRVRREWHAAKVAELESYLQALPEEWSTPPARTSILIGLAYHRALLESIERFLTDPAAALAVALGKGAAASDAQAATGSS